MVTASAEDLTANFASEVLTTENNITRSNSTTMKSNSGTMHVRYRDKSEVKHEAMIDYCLE